MSTTLKKKKKWLTENCKLYSQHSYYDNCILQNENKSPRHNERSVYRSHNTNYASLQSKRKEKQKQNYFFIFIGYDASYFVHLSISVEGKFPHSIMFTSIQNGISALRKDHILSNLSIRSFPN